MGMQVFSGGDDSSKPWSLDRCYHEWEAYCSDGAGTTKTCRLLFDPRVFDYSAKELEIRRAAEGVQQAVATVEQARAQAASPAGSTTPDAATVSTPPTKKRRAIDALDDEDA